MSSYLESDARARQLQLFEPNNVYCKKNRIKVKILNDWKLLAQAPTKANLSDAGWDLYSVEELDLLPGKRHAFHTGVSLEIPDGYVGLIWPRSGMSVKKGVDVLAGVVDAGYRGEIKVCLLNTGEEACKINKGDRISQILFQEVPSFHLTLSDLTDSDRGDNGFGSSGN